jgi:hypothetical protein
MSSLLFVALNPKGALFILIVGLIIILYCLYQLMTL